MLTVVIQQPGRIDTVHDFNTHDRTDKINPLMVTCIRVNGPAKLRALSLSNMPDSGNEIMYFFGDMARYVVANW